MDFKQAYNNLNAAQKEAVDTIDGPLLVVAGPGTGKTQLLSARVANILDKTDTLPHNVLCLTFTESGAANMRERLSQFIGQAAYDVTISTYHAFGGDILGRFSEYFDDRLETPVDNLHKYQIVEEIVNNLSFRDPLKQTRHHLRDLIATISEVKRALLSPDDLRSMAAENESLFLQVNDVISAELSSLKRMPSKFDKAWPYFTKVLSILEEYTPNQSVQPKFGSLAGIASHELKVAIEEATASESTKPLTAWKDKWLVKNALNQFVLSGELENKRLKSLANVLESYQKALSVGGFYDFDDMILRAIDALEANDDLRFTIQEQYLYILLDEYQDTNAAQAKLVQLITDNPVNEGRPNIMAVGDDDQAIYAFQGAQYSNMLDFFQHYKNTKLISLTDNYRSHADILAMAENIATQIDERLFDQLEGSSKSLTASNPRINSAHIERREFKSQIAENTFVASKIKQLIDQGLPASEIAVLTPRHSTLEALVPFTMHKDVPVSYEKRENILDTESVKQLLTMGELALLIANEDSRADSLWPEVLSYEFFAVPVSSIWQLGWKVSDHNRLNRDNPTNWAREMIASEDKLLRNIAILLLTIATKIKSESFELAFDYLVGLKPVSTGELDLPVARSPMLAYLESQDESTYYGTISNLTVLRSRFREYQGTSEDSATMLELLAWVDAYRSAGESLLNTSPYSQAAEAVQLMTVFKAKGLEFSHVFLLSADDTTWGGSGRANSNRLTLPKNLAPIRHSGATEDERLRLLFVALTRAKSALYLTSSSSNYSGKDTKRLKYLDEREVEGGDVISHAIPESQNRVVNIDDSEAPPLDSLIYDWQSKHINASSQGDLKSLLTERLASYQLSPTDLNKFTNLTYGGPQAFLLENLLGFRGAPNIDGLYGNAVHETLKWLQRELSQHGQLPTALASIGHLKDNIDRLQLPASDKERLVERGEAMLETYLAERGDMFKPSDKAEINFRYDNIRINEAHLTGTIDRLEIDNQNKTITVVDFKTGTVSPEKVFWNSRQLYFYKLLLEQSREFKNYTVTGGRLEYVEPNINGEMPPAKIVTFEELKTNELKNLIGIVWQKIQTLDLPDTSSYPASLAGSKQFEAALLNEQGQY